MALLLMLLIAGLLPAPALAAQKRERPTRRYAPSRHVPREVIVRYRADVPAVGRTAIRAEIEARATNRLPLPNTQVVKLPRGTTVADAIAELESDPAVVYAEPNYLVQAAGSPNDPLVPSMWPLRSNSNDIDIDAPEAWGVTTGSRDVTVAIIDSGVAYDHPDLRRNMVAGWDFIDDDNTPYDIHGHGTHVAGTVGAEGNNQTGVSGVNWNVSLMPLRVLEVDGFGTSTDVAAAIVHARQNGADVVNASLGGPDFSRSISAAISASPNMLFVAASGNDATNIDTTPDYPCNYSLPNIVCVSATTDRDTLSSFSNYGSSNVDIAAPGSSILSTKPHFETFFEDSFEGGFEEKWISGGTNNTWGQEADTYGGYVTDSPDGEYRNSTDAWLQMRNAVDLSSASACAVNFSLYLDTQESIDGLALEASRNGMSWEQLGGYSGDTGTWRTVTADLGSYTGGSAYLRFRMISDGAVTSEGAAIDEVGIECTTGRFTTRDYVTYSGTSMATPHVAGAAALLWAQDPAATALQIRDALLAGADHVAALDGKVDGGRRLSLMGALSALQPDLPIPDPDDLPLPTDPEPTTDPEPEPTSSASPTPTPTQSATPTPVPSAPPTAVTHSRSVSLKIAKHLIVSGRITTSGDPACVTKPQTIKIMRNGTVVKRVSVVNGAFQVKLPDRKGRYKAVAPRIGLPNGDACASAGSPERIHRH